MEIPCFCPGKSVTGNYCELDKIIDFWLTGLACRLFSLRVKAPFQLPGIYFFTSGETMDDGFYYPVNKGDMVENDEAL
jgi:hypothetical protein